MFDKHTNNKPNYIVFLLPVKNIQIYLESTSAKKHLSKGFI